MITTQEMLVVNSGNYLAEALQSFYTEGKRRYRGYTRFHTLIEALSLRGKQVGQSEVLDLFDKYEQRGLGKFVYDNEANKLGFAWNSNPIALFKASRKSQPQIVLRSQNRTITVRVGKATVETHSTKDAVEILELLGKRETT
jgi:hypothetical protein